MAIRSLGATRRMEHEQRSDEGLPLWKRLHLQRRMPVQSVHLQAVQLLTTRR